MTSRFGQRLIKQPLINFGSASIDAAAHIADLTIHFTEASIDHTAILNIGTNSHAVIDTHIADATIHFTEASIDHIAILNIGTNSHAAIDTHIADATIHFTQASIDHTAILNIGTNSHAAIDTHIADATIHFTEASIDHVNILNIGTNTHAQIDTHIADTNIHFGDAPADAQDYARNNNAWVVVSGGGASDLNSLTDVTLTAPVTGGVLFKSAGDWLDTDAIVIDPIGRVLLKDNTSDRFRTQTVGVEIFGTLGNTAESGGSQICELRFLNSGGAEIAAIGFLDQVFSDDDTLRIRNDSHGGGIRWEVQNAAGAEQLALDYSELAGFSLFHQNAIVFRTENNGISVRDGSGGDTRLALRSSTDTVLAELLTSATEFQVRNRSAGDDLRLTVRNAANTTDETGILIESDGSVSVFFDGTASFASESQGARVADSSGGGNPAVRWYDTIAGTQLAQSQHFAGDHYRDNRVNGGKFFFRASNAAPTDRSVMTLDPNAGGTLFFAGTAAFETETQGAGVADTTSNNPALRFYDNIGGTQLAQIQISGGGLFIDNGVNGGAVTFRSSTAAAGDETWMKHNQGGSIEFNFNGVLEASTKSGGFLIDDELEINGALNHDGTTIGFYGTTPAAQSAAYTRNATIVVDRTLLASASATTTNNNNVLAALIADLQAIGIIG